MAMHLNFRSALGGFNREDVVHYIEYMNSKHTSQVNQLNNQLEELRQELAALKAQPDLSAEVAALQDQLAQAHAQRQQLEDTLTQMEQAKALQAEETARELAAMELEAYRRAEQVERAARARAEQIYQQATGVLAQATTQVDSATETFQQIAAQVHQQMGQLQVAMDAGKGALADASTALYAIRTENAE